jgi:hypothetical protein
MRKSAERKVRYHEWGKGFIIEVVQVGDNFWLSYWTNWMGWIKGRYLGNDMDSARREIKYLRDGFMSDGLEAGNIYEA